MGYEVTVARYSKDFGIDLICKKPNETVVVEVKKWKKGNNVGNETVRSILGAMLKIKADKAVLVTTSDYTVSVEEQARGLPVELWNSRKLSKLMEKYFIT
jgi:HJR/Mrr/RecB family endonuclease